MALNIIAAYFIIGLVQGNCVVVSWFIYKQNSRTTVGRCGSSQLKTSCLVAFVQLKCGRFREKNRAMEACDHDSLNVRSMSHTCTDC